MSSRCPSSVVSLSHDVEVSKNSRQGGGNMRQLVTCVKRLYRDKKQLKAQVGAHFRSGVVLFTVEPPAKRTTSLLQIEITIVLIRK